jgi:predicted ATPase
MARLDRLGPAKEIAQLGAIIGREFNYELLQAISLLDEERLQYRLQQLVEAELVYQRGVLPQVRYLFKHALVQDTAYQSLLKSTRQRYHKKIAEALAERFAETAETQPELLAQHYTEAGMIMQSLPYWQQAGQRASQRSAYVEAIAHLKRGLEVLKALPDTSERAQQEVALQITLTNPLTALKGYSASEVEYACVRALALCRQIGEIPQLFWAFLLLSSVRFVQAKFQAAREFAEQCLHVAERTHDSTFLVWGHYMRGMVLCCMGEFALAQDHIEQSIALYDPQKDTPLASGALQDPKVTCLSYAALALWHLGYPDQALKRIREALTLAQELSHPFSLAFALSYASKLHGFRRERQAAQERAELMIALSTEQGFPLWLAQGTIQQGWTLTEKGQRAEGLAQIRQGLAAYRATGADLNCPYFFALLTEAHGRAGQIDEGLNVLADALIIVDKTGERFYEAELYRLRGELMLAQSSVQSLESRVKDAEDDFLRGIAIARKQQAKSLELRAVASLARLWQQQGKQKEAHQMLSEIYGWFSEGFDTKDLQEAKALLDELNH